MLELTNLPFNEPWLLDAAKEVEEGVVEEVVGVADVVVVGIFAEGWFLGVGRPLFSFMASMIIFIKLKLEFKPAVMISSNRKIL